MLYKTVDMLIFYNDAAGKIFLYCLFCIKQTFETVHNKQDISTFLQLYSNILKESGEVFCLFNKRSKRLKCLFQGRNGYFTRYTEGVVLTLRTGLRWMENISAKNGYPHGNGKPLEGTPPQCPRASAARAAAAGQEKKRRPLNGFRNRFEAALSPSPAGERDSWGYGKHQTITGFWESCCICCYFAILVAKFIRICATSARVAVPVGSRRLPPIPALPESSPEPTAQRTAAAAQSEVALASL